jgi:hypothetical protein
LYLDDSTGPYQWRKRDRVWRVLRFGHVAYTLDRYHCYNYRDLWLTIVTNGPQKQIVAAYKCDEWPDLDPNKLRYSDHAAEQMKERGIQEKDVFQLSRDCIVYDRTGRDRYRFTGLVWGDKLNVVVNTRTNYVVTAFWK